MLAHNSPFLSLAQLAQILGTLPDPVFILTRSGCYAAVFGGQDARYYHDGSGLVGLLLEDVLQPEKTAWFLRIIARALAEPGLHVVEYGLARGDVRGLERGAGPDHPIMFEGRVQRLDFLIDGEEAVLWVASNITERHALELRLREASETDALTGLGNRRHFESVAMAAQQRALRYGHPLSLLMFDVDHFKLINDSCGHQSGDEVLAELAALVRDCTRESDSLARWGGEEFVLLMPEIGLETAQQAAEKVRAGVEAHVFRQGLKITASFGVAEWDLLGEDLVSLVGRADDALYRAKNEGRNRCVIDGPGLAGGPVLPLRWRPQYACGHPDIDREHRALFEASARMRRLAAIGGGGRDTLRITLEVSFTRLIEDLAAHYRNEEGILREAGWAGTDAHCEEHEIEMARVRVLHEAFTSGLDAQGKPVEVEALMRELSVEVVRHMLGADRAFFGALGQRGLALAG